MTVKEISELLNVDLATNPSDEKVTGCYVCDLLSWVMGRAKAGDVWLTVMGNINSIAVASLADIPLIILCEGSQLDPQAKQSAEKNGITVAKSNLDAYSLAIKISKILR